MRVVHVITRLLQAGSEENTVASCLHQADHGLDVVLAHGEEFHDGWYDKLSSRMTLVRIDDLVHRIDPRQDLKAYLALRRLYRELRPDIVHTHQSKAGILGRLAARSARVPAIVHTVHIAPFLGVGGAKKSFYVAAERLCARRTDVMINVSRGMQQACLDHGVGEQAKHRVIHSGMPIDNFIGAGPVTDWREQIGGWDGSRPKIVLMLAAFEPRKRQQAFIEAMAPVLKRRADICVALAGKGTEMEACRRRVDELGLAGQVRFLGHVSAPQALIAHADLCVLTSEREGLPRVVVQYLAVGKPAIVSEIPGIDEVVIDGVNGVVTDASDLSGTAAAIERLVEDDAERLRLQAGARATDVSHWCLERMGEEIEAAYRETLAAKGAPPA